MVFPFPYPGPIPPYTNLPIQSNYYAPSLFFISAITQGTQTIVTTTVNHNYVVSQQVRLVIPQANGIQGLNETLSYVLNIPNPNQVTLSINSNGLNPFVSTSNPNQPQILAVGDISFGNTNSSGIVNTGTYIPGAFINISPE